MKNEIQHFLDEGKIKEAAAFIKNAIKSGANLENMNINLAHLLLTAGEWEEITTLLPKDTNFFHTSGWLNSIKINRPISGDNKPIPWFTYPAIDFLDDIVKNDWSVFEWGSGNSTLWWASKVEKVIAIEDNQTWFMEVKNKLPQNSEIFLKTGNEYFDSILMYPDCSFDAIIIDGSHRNEAAVNCSRKIKDQGIIIFDNSDAMDHEPAQRYLTSLGFYRIDFWGLIPSYLYKNCTSMYFKDADILKQKKIPTNHRSSVGVSCQQFIDRIRGIALDNMSSIKDNNTEEMISERHALCKKTSPMQNHPNVNTIVFFLSKREAYRPIMFSTNEVFCSPDCEYTTSNGIVKTIQTHGGVYDSKQVIDQLSLSQKPELIVVKTDATGRNFPTNLNRYNCPKLLILGDTHHLKMPIQTLLVYAAQEKFDYIFSDHDRHHLHYFKEAGFDKVFWIPCFNVYPHEQPLFADKLYGVSFVGQVGRWHPYRKTVLQFLHANDIPVKILQAPHEKAAEIHAKSLINLNISLNGDLNLRVFEVLSSGGFLLTDRLSRESGLDMIFKDGEHLVCYDSRQDLVEKIHYYLKHPSEAKIIAQKGYEQYIRHHTPESKINELMDYIFKGRLNPFYDIQQDSRSIYVRSNSKADLFQRIAVYEYFQGVHLKNQELTALFSPSVDPRLICDVSDLPRLRLHIKINGTDIPDASLQLFNDTGVAERIHGISSEDHKKAQDAWDIVVLAASDLVDQNLEYFLISMNFKLLVVSDSLSLIDEDRCVELMKYLSINGFEKIHENPDVFFWKDKSLWGEYLFSKGLTTEAVKNFERALLDNPANENALNNLGVISYQLNQYDAAENFLLKAVSLNRRNINSLNNLVQLYMTMEQFEEAAGLLWEITGMNPEQPEPWYLLGVCQERLNHLDDAIDAFKKAEEFGASAYPMPEGMHAQIEKSLIIKNNSESRISPKKILVINNLYPPQEMGGYGRLLFDFTNILRKRGHSIYVLTSDTPYLGKAEGDAPDIDRSLVLFGGWEGGVCKPIENRDDIIRIVRKNIAGLEQVLKEFRPDACLLGNIDFLSRNIVDPILDKKIPIIHHLGNQHPGYIVNETPKSRLYHLATASRWLKNEIKKQKYPLKDISVIYPGALVDEFKMRIPPALDKLRIAYASIVLPYKGPHILINALKKLHVLGIDFFCSIAGTSTDQDFVDTLKSFVAESDLEDKIRFTGFLTREELKNLFARHNVLVFPSIVKEAFGISQVEAMAAGLTVVTSGTGGAKEIVEHGVSGIIFKTEDDGSLADELIQLAKDTRRCQQIALAGQRRAIEKFDIERSVDALESCFDRRLHNKAVP